MSSPPTQWSHDNEIGVDMIDRQHEYFASLINRLAELMPTRDPKQRAYLISELNAYARFHFISEENLMRDAGYPDLDVHTGHHRELINELSNLETTLEMRKSVAEINELIAFLTKWFIQHTTKEDRQFADFVHSATQ